MEKYDLIIIGAGSGNMLPTDGFGHWRIAIVESDRFGGTCLNRGCIPSKMLVYTADVASTIRDSERFGIRSAIESIDWPEIRARVFGRIDPIHDEAVTSRRRDGIDVYLGPARFVAPYELDVEGVRLRGDRIVVAVGTRPVIPDIVGLDEVPHHTSDTIMRIAALPSSMLVLGGGYIGAEMSHVFGSVGTDVTIVHRGDSMLPSQDRDVRRRFTEIYQSRFDVRLNTVVERVQTSTLGLVAHLVRGDGSRSSIEVETMLVAVGRTPNTDQLAATSGGLELDEHGRVRSDDAYATNVPGVWALGDTTNHFQLKHMANAEARIVQHNLMHPDAPRRAKFPVVPAAVFADPQVATVGATEDQLIRDGRPYRVGTRDYSTTAYGWALEDTTGFVKVLGDPETGMLLGAHIIGHQAATLIQPLIQAMMLGNSIEQIARQVLYIHPALTEVVENALLDLMRST